MGWKGTLRSIAAAQRRAEREARRRQRQLQVEQKQFEKMKELERAAHKVNLYENHIDLLLSVHKDCSNDWDWETMKSEAPIKPIKSNKQEHLAQTKLDKFNPGFLNNLLGTTDSKRKKLAEAVNKAKEKDDEVYQKALEEYTDKLAINELAAKILDGDASAYLDAIRQTEPFKDIGELGSSIEVSVNKKRNHLVNAILRVNSEKVIPSETRSLLQSGKLSVKKMPKGKFYELYQDYVCSCVLRVARELFALLPIEIVIVNAVGEVLNTKTGHMEEQPIVSAAISRKTLLSLNFDTLDPSDSMGNFVHRMNFQKTKGFLPIEAIEAEELQQ